MRRMKLKMNNVRREMMHGYVFPFVLAHKKIFYSRFKTSLHQLWSESKNCHFSFVNSSIITYFWACVSKRYFSSYIASSNHGIAFIFAFIFHLVKYKIFLNSLIFISQVARGCWWYYFSKFTEFFDTVSLTIVLEYIITNSLLPN